MLQNKVYGVALGAIITSSAISPCYSADTHITAVPHLSHPVREFEVITQRDYTINGITSLEATRLIGSSLALMNNYRSSTPKIATTILHPFDRGADIVEIEWDVPAAGIPFESLGFINAEIVDGGWLKPMLVDDYWAE